MAHLFFSGCTSQTIVEVLTRPRVATVTPVLAQEILGACRNGFVIKFVDNKPQMPPELGQLPFQLQKATRPNKLFSVENQQYENATVGAFTWIFEIEGKVKIVWGITIIYVKAADGFRLSIDPEAASAPTEDNYRSLLTMLGISDNSNLSPGKVAPTLIASFHGAKLYWGG